MITVLGLGAGVQSTTLALLAATGDLSKPDVAIFADTRWEPPSVYHHLARLRPFLESHGIPVHIVTGGDIRANFTTGQQPDGSRCTKRTLHAPAYTRVNGRSPGRILRSCTHKYKIVPIEREISRLIGRARGQSWPKKVVVEQWFGISSDEKQRMRVSQIKAIRFRYPLIERGWNRQRCVEWLKDNGWPDVPRSACIGCPHRSNAEWRGLTPKDFTEACAVEKEMQANKWTGLKGVPYLHRSGMPLADADLTDPDHDPGQGDLFGVETEECAGMCGV